MKAYSVTDKNGDCTTCIVFAESRGKAIHYALNCSGVFDWAEWTDMRAIRVPELDEYYKGNPEMDWHDDRERSAMVRYAGLHCSYEYDVALNECKQCSGHEWCDRYEAMSE